MMTSDDLKSRLRDLVLIEEDVIGLIRTVEFRDEDAERLMDNIKQKQIIITKIIGYLD